MSDSPLNAALNRNWIKASAEHERLERENADLRADRDRAFKIGYEITDDCQTVEEMTSALVACIQRVRMNKDKELADLRAKLEAARKDAERYRHLRDHGGADLFGGTASMSIGKHPMIVYFAPSLNHANMVSLFAENADYMVDAAIAQGKGEK